MTPGSRCSPEASTTSSAAVAFDALMSTMLTPENRALLAVIRDRKPQSVAELVKMTGRAQPNLTRTLAKLEAADVITMEAHGRRKSPTAAVKKIDRRCGGADGRWSDAGPDRLTRARTGRAM